MRRVTAPRWAVCLITLASLTMAQPMAAQGDWDDFDEEDEASGIGAYFSNLGNRLAVGTNSLVTWPVDPLLSTITPREEFDELPGGVVTRYPVGLVQGTMLSLYRASMGALDIGFAPLTPFKMLSPEPRFMIFPGVEHEEY